LYKINDIFRHIPTTFIFNKVRFKNIQKQSLMNLYLGNFHYSVTEEEIRQLFEKYAELESVNIILDKKSGKSKGFAFVELKDDAVALRAIEELNGKVIRGRTLKLSQAQ